MEVKCLVCDESGKVFIFGGDVIDLLSKEYMGEVTHAGVGYYKDMDDVVCKENKILRVFPIEKVYFIKNIARKDW